MMGFATLYPSYAPDSPPVFIAGHSHDGEHRFKKVPAPFLQLRVVAFVFPSRNERQEKRMRKFAYVLAAVTAMAVAAPTLAGATEFGVRVGPDYYGDRYYSGPRVGFYGHDRGWHRGWYSHDDDRDRIVIRRHHWDD
jgi:hypothetical protein